MLASLVLSALFAAPAPEGVLNGNVPLKLTPDEETALDDLKRAGVTLEDDRAVFSPGSSVGYHAPPPGVPRPTEEDFQPLARLKRLRNLSLYGAPVGDATLDAVSGMADLQELNLTHTKVTDDGLKKLAGLKNLACLILERTAVTNAGLRTLADFPALDFLSLNGTRVTDDGLAALEKNDHLQALFLGEDPGIGDAALTSLGRMTNLRTLALTNGPVTDKGLAAMAKAGAFPKLGALSLYGAALTEEGLKALEDPKVLPYLKTLTLKKTEALTRAAEALHKARPALEVDLVP